MFVVANFAQKTFAVRTNESKVAIILFGITWFSLISLTYFVYLLFSGNMVFSLNTVIISLFAGLFFAFASSTAQIALKDGPMSLTILIISFASIFPTILSAIFLNDKFTLI